MLTKINNFLLVLIFLCITVFPIKSVAFTGKVVKVVDGDTIHVRNNNTQEKIRLFGIDCPERKQAFGKKAKRFAQDLVAGKEVNVTVVDRDRYGRSVGLVYAGDICLNESLVEFGFAWVYPKYCNLPRCTKWTQKQRLARINQLGLWYDADPVPPWEWRKKKRKGNQ